MELLYEVLAVVGGGGVIVTGLWKLLGGIWRDRIKEHERRKTEVQLEVSRQHFGLRRVQADRFANSQYEVYLQLWESLQSLHLTVDALWHKATIQNVAALAQELKNAKSRIQKWSMFFEDEHYTELLQLIEHLEQFRAGKVTLIDIRKRSDLRLVFPEVVQEQIKQNLVAKEQFERLLETLRRSFRDRLSRIEVDVA